MSFSDWTNNVLTSAKLAWPEEISAYGKFQQNEPPFFVAGRASIASSTAFEINIKNFRGDALKFAQAFAFGIADRLFLANKGGYSKVLIRVSNLENDPASSNVWGFRLAGRAAGENALAQLGL